MITSLEIKNFKGWKDTGPLKLAPITVFFGANSSGKSSIGQFLMMLKQTAASPDRTCVLHPGDTQSPVDLGTFDDLLYKHDVKSKLMFGLGWKLPEPLKISDFLTTDSFTGDHLTFSSTIGFNNGKKSRAVCESLSYELWGHDGSRQKLSISMASKTANGKYEITCSDLNLVRKQGRAWPLPYPVRFFGFPDEMVNYYQNADTLNDLPYAMQSMLRQLAYLGPLREEPKRNYTWPSDVPEDVGSRGNRWVNAFLAASDRLISSGYKKKGTQFAVLVADWLKRLGVIETFEVYPVTEGSREYKVRVKINATCPSVSIPDVGFGVSQVLPVVVESFYAPHNSTVLIEQPELHLHPSVQQNLADLFIASAKSWEKGRPKNLQFIVESHSEHFLRRLQRRMAEGVIGQDEVAIYFCSVDKDGSKATPLALDLYGNITNWPKDFFGDQMTDIAEMQLACIRRRKVEAGK